MTDSTPSTFTDGTADVPTDQDVSEDDLLLLARIAGLPVGEKRAAGLALDLSASLAAARELDPLLAHRPGFTSVAFDPAWPDLPDPPVEPAMPGPGSDGAISNGAAR